ncbi:MAG: hypothetical protein CM15mP125_0880 [Gammaproteobacteria bacterium]|nr:MAG: hypothetical protein CM15mP125_0880 [Gammaproteobacteria bacterium]
MRCWTWSMQCKPRAHRLLHPCCEDDITAVTCGCLPLYSEYVAHTLDMGASGILFPRISTHVEAANAVGKNAVSRRRRGFSLSQSWLFWAIESQQFVEANDHNLLAAGFRSRTGDGLKDADKK